MSDAKVTCVKCGSTGRGHRRGCSTGKNLCATPVGAFMSARDAVRETGEPRPIAGAPGWSVRPVKEVGDV